MWDNGWDKLFEGHEWGRYPPLELVRVIARNFFSAENRATVEILEIGCGPGANLRFLADEGFSAHGIDGSQVAIEQAQQRLEGEGLKVELQKADAMALPYPDSRFDAVIDIECLYANTLADTRIILDEVHRVLKPGGLLFSTTFATGLPGSGPPLDDEPNTYTEYSGGPLHEGYGVVRLTAEEEIQDLYGVFDAIEYDYLIRSDGNRNTEVREWMITCRKEQTA